MFYSDLLLTSIGSMVNPFSSRFQYVDSHVQQNKRHIYSQGNGKFGIALFKNVRRLVFQNITFQGNMTLKKFYQKIDMLIEGDKGKLIINNETTELKETQRQTLEDRNNIRKNTTNGGKNIRFVSAMWKWKKGKQSYGYKSGVRMFFSSPWKIFNLPDGPNRWLETAKEKVGKVKDGSVEIIQSEDRKKKNGKKI